MKEYWIKYHYDNGHESIVVIPSKFKLCLWLLRNAKRCTYITISVMWDM